mgnify:CR=1 FL=1
MIYWTTTVNLTHGSVFLFPLQNDPHILARIIKLLCLKDVDLGSTGKNV